MRKLVYLMCITVMSTSLYAGYTTGGDAATQADATGILDIVFAIDTSGSMNDDAGAISNAVSGAINSLQCSKGDIWVRAKFVGIGSGSYGSTIFNESMNSLGLSTLTNSVEDNGPAVQDLVNNYAWNNDAVGTQKYFKAIVTIGDEGTENGHPVDGTDWLAAYNANQAAIANNVFVFSWLANPYYSGTKPTLTALFTAMAEGGGGGGYTFGDTGGIFIDGTSQDSAYIASQLQTIFCVAGTGGTIVPAPGAILLAGFGTMLAGKVKRRIR